MKKNHLLELQLAGFLPKCNNQIHDACVVLQQHDKKSQILFNKILHFRKFDQKFYSQAFTKVAMETGLDYQLEYIGSNPVEADRTDALIFPTALGRFYVTPYEHIANILLTKLYHDDGDIPTYSCLYTTYQSKRKLYVMWYIDQQQFVAPSMN